MKTVPLLLIIQTTLDTVNNTFHVDDHFLLLKIYWCARKFTDLSVHYTNTV